MIIAFPQKPRVVITRALITSQTEGGRTVRHDPPRPHFFLDYEDGEDCYLVWDGPDYLGAIEAAGDWLADGIEVRDRVAAPWGRA